MKTDYIKWIITAITGLTTVLASGGRLMAQTTDTTEAGTYSNGLSKAAKAAPTIKITYPDYTSADDYACFGDTILITATADGIKDLIVPQGDDWEGDSYVDKSVSNTITKRFFVYQGSSATNKKEYEFMVEYSGGLHREKLQTIYAKSCPPTTKAANLAEALTKPNTPGTFNLGFCPFQFIFGNKTTRFADIHFKVVTTPEQYGKIYETRTPNKEGFQEITYRLVPYCDADYIFDITYNEGNRNYTVSLGPFRRTVAPDDKTQLMLTPDHTSYCSGNPITFSLQLPEIYEKMLLQKAGNKDVPSISRCFEWNTPDGTSVTLSAWDESTHKYTFTTTAAGDFQDYGCKMSAALSYKSSSSKPVIDTTLDVCYDLQIKPFTIHASQALTTDAIDACEGNTINLNDYLSGTGMTIEGYTRNDGKFTAGTTYTVPNKTEKLKVKIQSVHCGIFEPDLTVNVTPKPYISALSVSHDTLICEGEPLRLAAEINPEAKATVTWTKTQGSNTTPIADNELDHFILQNDAAITIEAVSSIGCGSHSKLFNVRIGPRPTVQIRPNSATDCPGRKVSLKGDSPGSNWKFQLRDVQGNTLTPPELSDAYGLDNYTLKENDDLILTYTADQTTSATGFVPASVTCAASTTAPIKAHPLPEVQITYDGQAHRDGATICVPRNQPLTLTASGTADSYLWDNNTTTNQATYNMPNDQSITVEGTENTHGCKNTVKVYGVVSVNPVGSTAKSICPGEEVRFTAENDLPNTEYVWRDPQGNSVGNSHEYHASDLQPGQEGEYKLEITRSTCTWKPLTYQLAFHPYPKLEVKANNPACQGDELVINYLHSLPASEHPTYSLKRADGSEISGGQLTGDRVIYRMPDIQPAQAGTYTFTIASSHNCTATDIMEIEVDQPVAANMVFEADQTTFCEDEAAMLIAEALPDGDYTYKWHNDARTVYEGNEARIPVIWQRTDNGTLYLEIIQRVCRSSAQKDITVIPRPHLSGMPQDTGLCTGMPLCLKPVSDIKPDQITWFFIGENGKVTPLEQGANPDLTYCWAQVDALMNGRYFVDATVNAAHKNCVSHSDTMKLTVYPLPDIRIEGPNFICDGDTVTLTAVSQTEGSNRWSPSGQTTETIAVTKAGRYGVTRISTYGCRDSAETRLEARPLPYFSLPPDTSICRGTSFMIYGPENMDTYLWNDGSEEKDRLADDGGWYILTVFRNECPFTDSLYVHESFCGQFHFPTAFSPNDNRVNDTWGAISAAKDEDMAEYDLMVFDRNGKKVFHGKRISEQWDGKYKGQLCPPGVYTYSFRALEKEEGIKYRSNGTVTIVL